MWIERLNKFKSKSTCDEPIRFSFVGVATVVCGTYYKLEYKLLPQMPTFWIWVRWSLFLEDKNYTLYRQMQIAITVLMMVVVQTVK